MIKINDLSKPEQLTDEVIKKKTQEFLDSGKKKVVWRNKYITDRLKEMSKGKCCYCECKLGSENNDLHVDHFHHKDGYPDEVVLWENLLPACNRCNSKKGKHDTCKEPIVNPRYDDPCEHLQIYQSWYSHKTKMGKITWKLLGLNDTKILSKRHKISDYAIESFQRNLELAEEICKRETPDSTKLADLRNGIINLLQEAQCDYEYSATVATSILGHPDYSKLKDYLVRLDLWESIEDLAIHAEKICML